MSATSSARNAVETVVDLLEGIPNGYGGYGYNYGSDYGNGSLWDSSQPEIHAKTDFSQSQRESNPTPALYVWSPVDTDFQEFDAEGSHLRQTDTVEIEVWTLDEANTAEFWQDIVDYLSGYMRDNNQNTNWHQIKPVGGADNRSEHIREMTDHYITTLQLELGDHRPTTV